MYGYLAKRLALVFPTLILVTMLVFLLMRLVPGDPAYLRLIGADGDAEFTQEQLGIRLSRNIGRENNQEIWL